MGTFFKQLTVYKFPLCDLLSPLNKLFILRIYQSTSPHTVCEKPQMGSSQYTFHDTQIRVGLIIIDLILNLL